MKTNEWICPKGHAFVLRSGNFACLDEDLMYLDPKIGADDSPCGGCTRTLQEGCALNVARYFEVVRQNEH